MKKTKRFLFPALLVLMGFLLQSCFEITEEVTIRQDRSGTLVLSAGVNKSNSVFGLIESLTDIAFLDDIDNDVNMVTDIIKKQEGISNVTYTKPFPGRYQLSFDFADGKALNNALYAAAGQEKKFFEPAFYKIGKTRYRRRNITNWAALFLEREKENLPDETLFDLIEYNAAVHLPREIKSVGGEDVIVSKDNKTVTTSNFVSDILNKRINTKIVVRY